MCNLFLKHEYQIRAGLYRLIFVDYKSRFRFNDRAYFSACSHFDVRAHFNSCIHFDVRAHFSARGRFGVRTHLSARYF